MKMKVQVENIQGVKEMWKLKIAQLAEAHECLFDAKELMQKRSSQRKAAFSLLHLCQPAKSTGKNPKSTKQLSTSGSETAKTTIAIFVPAYKLVPGPESQALSFTEPFTCHALSPASIIPFKSVLRLRLFRMPTDQKS